MMLRNLKITAIMPARSGSKRLINKNIYPVCGRPMLSWGIMACKNSRFIDSVYVSSDCRDVLRVAQQYRASHFKRPKSLADDKTCKQDVIAHAVQTLIKKPDIVISLQPNSPEVTAHDLDGAILKFDEFDRNEIFSVDRDLIQNAAFRVMRYDYVFQKTISTKCGCYITDCIDVHTIDDVRKVEERGRL